MREIAGDEAVKRTHEENSGRNERSIEVIIVRWSNGAEVIRTREGLLPWKSIKSVCIDTKTLSPWLRLTDERSARREIISKYSFPFSWPFES